MAAKMAMARIKLLVWRVCVLEKILTKEWICVNNERNAIYSLTLNSNKDIFEKNQNNNWIVYVDKIIKFDNAETFFFNLS